MSPHLVALGWQLLAEGGIADLYLVPQGDGRILVYKILRDDSPANRRAFSREYRVLKVRVHEGLVPVLAGEMDGPQPYYVMPFLTGGRLTAWAGGLQVDTVRGVARKLAETIAALHRNEIEHGDIKLDNMLVTKEGDVQVSDPLGNGSGCTLTWGTKWGGTPGYWAPEIAYGHPISKAGDVYSFGATLYHLVTGAKPQDGDTLDPWLVNTAVPHDLRQLILWTCRSDPATRPTIHQVVAFLAPNPQQHRPGSTKLSPAASVLLGSLACAAFIVEAPAAGLALAVLAAIAAASKR